MFREFKVTFSFWNLVFQRIKQPSKWKKFWFQIEWNQIVLDKPNMYFLFCFSNRDEPYNVLLLWVSPPTSFSFSILSSLYHLCHHFTPSRQILVAGTDSEMEVWGCQPSWLKWLSWNGLCERGGWIQLTCVRVPALWTSWLWVSKAAQAGANSALQPQSSGGGWGISVASLNQAFRSSWSWAPWFGEVLNTAGLAGRNVSHLSFPVLQTSFKGF